MPDASFPWAVVPAYAVLMAARWINRRIDQPPRPRPAWHETPTQVTITRPRRELEQRNDP